MKLFQLIILIILFFPLTLYSHGPGEHRKEEEDGHGHVHELSSSGKSFKKTNDAHNYESCWWVASLATGWESRHIHYGVDETGNSGAWTAELAGWVKDFTFSVCSGFGIGNNFQEWDFTVAYNCKWGALLFIPGYNFRYIPNHMIEEHDHQSDHDHEHNHKEESHEHAHKTYGNELFFVLGQVKKGVNMFKDYGYLIRLGSI